MNELLEKQIDEYIKVNHYRLVNSVLVWQQGEIIAERYYNSSHRQSMHQIFSVWKSIISLCIGICMDRGLLTPEDPVGNYLEAFDGTAHPYHRHLKIRDLLTMQSGIYWHGGIHYHCPMLEQLWRADDWCEYIADVAMADFPGRKFAYKEWDVILLAAIIKSITGEPAFELCRRFLYEPLGIESERWGESRGGVCYNQMPGFENRANLSAGNLLKIGQLILRDGRYEERQIVSAEYVEAMCRPHVPAYGYLIWQYPGYVACRGLGGQEVIISKEKELITVIQASWTSRGKSYGDIFTNLINRKLQEADEEKR